MKTKYNLIIDADSYKADHRYQLPDGTANIQSSGVPRRDNTFSTGVVYSGSRYACYHYLSTRITTEMVDEAEYEITSQGYVFDRADWDFLVEHNEGRIPLRIRAVKEGTPLPAGVAPYFVEATPGFEKYGWLAPYFEDILLRNAWKHSTVATLVFNLRRLITEFAIETGTDLAHVDYSLHNFGDRGADTHEGAIVAAVNHTLGFNGTDCLQGNKYINDIYGTKRRVYGTSVIASEHMTMCANSDADRRDDYGAAVMMLNRLEAVLDAHAEGKWLNVAPIVSIVIDTYDDERFVKEYIGKRLKDRVIALGKRGGKVVLRPDTGDTATKPIDVITWLMDAFGYTTTKTGHKALPAFVGVIQGDGINYHSIIAIFANMRKYN